METTRLSSKGQIVLPKSIRASRAWAPGTEFTVEESGDGMLLRPAAKATEAQLDRLVGCLRSKRKPATDADMRTAVRKNVKRRHDLGRY
jgi:AbrB family looped-hinge helix DNA binding protein